MRFELRIGFSFMRPTLIIAAFIAASPALAAHCPQGQFFRVRLDECVSSSSPLARPYLEGRSLRKHHAERKTIDTANLGEELETPTKPVEPRTGTKGNVDRQHDSPTKHDPLTKHDPPIKHDPPAQHDPPATSDPLAADPPPNELDETAWRLIPLLRAAESRWADMVSPPRDETPPPDPWPWLSVYGLGKRPQQ